MQKNDLEVISLLNKNTNWVARLNKLGIFLFFSILVVNIFAFLVLGNQTLFYLFQAYLWLLQLVVSLYLRDLNEAQNFIIVIY